MLSRFLSLSISNVGSFGAEVAFSDYIAIGKERFVHRAACTDGDPFPISFSNGVCPLPLKSVAIRCPTCEFFSGASFASSSPNFSVSYSNAEEGPRRMSLYSIPSFCSCPRESVVTMTKCSAPPATKPRFNFPCFVSLTQ